MSAYIVDGSGFRFPLVDAFLQDGVYEKEFSYHRFQFVSDGETWNEQYLFSSTWLAEPPVPTKENRVFAGWSASDGSIVNLAELKDAAVTERTTLYAVWNHPADDKWEWKSNGDNHWKECNCGDKEEGHTAQWNEGVVTKEPTDTENGEIPDGCRPHSPTPPRTAPAQSRVRWWLQARRLSPAFSARQAIQI